MNFIVFDPSFLQENRLKDLINSYKVSEIYSLLPYCEKTDTLLSNSSVPVSVKRQKGETIDSVKRRAVDRKSTRLNSSHIPLSRMPSSA